MCFTKKSKQKFGEFKNYFKIQIDYSDHKLIYVDMKINVQKIQKNSTTARDYRKIRSNPQFFLKRLSRRNWNVLENMKKVDDMVILRTKETNDCLDECACVHMCEIHESLGY